MGTLDRMLLSLSFPQLPRSTHRSEPSRSRKDMVGEETKRLRSPVSGSLQLATHHWSTLSIFHELYQVFILGICFRANVGGFNFFAKNTSHKFHLVLVSRYFIRDESTGQHGFKPRTVGHFKSSLTSLAFQWKGI